MRMSRMPHFYITHLQHKKQAMSLTKDEWYIYLNVTQHLSQKNHDFKLSNINLKLQGM
jgi:hypothetical protein